MESKSSADSLNLIDISKTYITGRVFPFLKQSQKIKALDSVSLTLKPGFYGLLGPNGSGKSTLMNIIVGLLRQDTGLVLWNKQSVFSLGVEYRRILGYMPQQQTLYDNYTGRRFLNYIAALKEIPAKEVWDEVTSAARAVNLLDNLDFRISAYSGGMKQRLLAAAAMMHMPRLLIMDEPMAGLDPKERVHLRNTLAEKSKTCIVIIATHIVSDVENVADEILILKKGRLCEKDTPGNLIEKYSPGESLESVYLSVFGTE